MERPTTDVAHASRRANLEPSTESAPSKAAIAGHPIHPMLVPFPLALLSLVPVTDIIYATTDSTFWAWVSYYLLWGGILSAGLAAVFGLIDFIGVHRVRTLRAGWAHMLLNVTIVALTFVNLLMREANLYADIVPSGLILSIVAAGLLIVSGYFGGELVYRHKIGISDR